MVRGQRDGAVTKADLLGRLLAAFPGVSIPKSAKLKDLLGHAIFHKLVTAKEVDETTPRIEKTLPCYLFTYVKDATLRARIETYVVATSKLFCRGSILLNLIAQTVCGPRLAGATDCSVPVWRPAFHLDDDLPAWMPTVEPLRPIPEGLRTLANILDPDGGNVEGNTLKHAFLPERWPSAQVPRRAEVVSVMACPIFGGLVPPAPPGWLDVMSGHVSGWDNAINRMMTKYCGNVQVHAIADLPAAVRSYLWVAPLSPDAPRVLLTDVVFCPLRPLVASNADWAMAMDLRLCLMGEAALKVVVATSGPFAGKKRCFYVHGHVDNNKVDYSPSVLLLHLFLCRYGRNDRSYLPVASRGRKYAYIDTKVAGMLFRGSTKRKHAGAGPSTSAAAAADDVSTSVSIGEVLGITPAEFNRRRKELRTSIRRHKRRNLSGLPKGSDRQKRAKREKKHWDRVGASRMPSDVRIDSVETDGVGLRIVLKIKEDLRDFVVPVGAKAVSNAPVTGKKRPRGKNASKAAAVVDAVPDPAAGGPPPLFVATDEGRAKLFSAAISQDATKKPTSMAFHRGRYYHEMGHSARQRWEAAVMAASAPLRLAVDCLSASGGLRNCDPELWRAYLAAETAHRQVLDDEFVGNVDRAKWEMRMFRSKRKSLDQAMRRLMVAATTTPAGRRQPLERPLVVGVGAANFAACGPQGELPAPISQLSKAMRRAIQAVRATGRHVVTYSVDEFRTTMCCCACGSVTLAPTVRRRKRNKITGEADIQDGPSRRLRRCTTCSPDGKLRDRDVQGARNILWLTQALFFGLPRPDYMCRG